MKSKYLSLALLGFLFAACNNTSNDETFTPVDENEQITEPANDATTVQDETVAPADETNPADETAPVEEPLNN
ncbi:hypothetical protein GKC56_08195 [Neisseriaceae bacterium PsAf]|nr:hypothetical protein [Neisseriaceae bacterium PsAf]